MSDRRARLFLPDTKILHIPDDMLALAVDLDEIAAAGERVLQDRFRIEARAALVERCQHKIGAMPDRAPVGGQRAGQEVDERRLAHAMGADQAETIAAQDADREILDDHALAKRLR